MLENDFLRLSHYRRGEKILKECKNCMIKFSNPFREVCPLCRSPIYEVKSNKISFDYELVSDYY